MLKRGVDAEKDQSYFLYPLSQEQLSRALFPLGEMTKRQTRELARSFGLKVCDKSASQDVCFVGTGDYRRYLAERFPESVRPGPIVDGQGRVIGEHGGIAFYTVGQRKRLGIAASERLYVLSVDASTATVVVGGRDDMRTEAVSVRQMNWIAFEHARGPLELNVRLRYREPEVAAHVLPGDDGGAEVRFAEPHARVGAGQSAVFYDGDVVVGGGIIE